MSGGFFRGTSADQDTRFSNKQAKLMKSQKFAPELEHLVDMTKVKMDVMRPWIANRVTELIGFEDEVLINFIYGLLDGKEVNGKEVQISLTGFMERNTGKFMKELWLLLLSAQNNASGVPQQFLDAKEEETKKKKAESDRLANEIQRRKEKEHRELEQQRTEKMDRGYTLKEVDRGADLSTKREHRPSAIRSTDEKEFKDENGSRGRSRVSRSPHSANRSPSPRGMHSQSISKSFSNSASYSGERRRSRSLSASNKRREHSTSSEKDHYSPRCPRTSHGRHSPRYSPSRRSSYSRRRSPSRSDRRSPSPIRYRMRRRSRSPLRRRSRSPFRRRPRSPTRRSSPWNRSRSPIRRRSSSVTRRSPSPIRRKSPSPVRQRSPYPMRPKYRGPPSPRRRSRSPIRHRSRSPLRHRSRSPIRRRSRSPIQYRSRTPIRRKSLSPIRDKSKSPSGSRFPRRSPRLAGRNSPSSREWSSASPVQQRSPSPIGRRSPKRHGNSPLQSPRQRIRHGIHSPVRDTIARNAVDYPTDVRRRSNSVERRSGPQPQNDSPGNLKRLSPSPHRSPISEAQETTTLKSGKIHRSYSSNPSRKERETRLHNDSSENSSDGKETFAGESTKTRYNSSARVSSSDKHKLSHMENREDVSPPRESKSETLVHQKKPDHQDSRKIKDTLVSEESPIKVRNRVGEKNQSRSGDTRMNDEHLEHLPKLSRKEKQNDRSPSVSSDSEGSDKNRAKVKDKRKNKRSGRRELESDDESSYDSYAEERKEAKRKRKEERRTRKEEKRRRREERRRRKEGKRSGKQKLKSGGSVLTPSDSDGKHDNNFDDEQGVKKLKSGQDDKKEPLTDQKKLEIELREKAIELYMAKKGISH